MDDLTPILETMLYRERNANGRQFLLKSDRRELAVERTECVHSRILTTSLSKQIKQRLGVPHGKWRVTAQENESWLDLRCEY